MLSEPTDFCRLYLFRHPELEASQQTRAVGAGPADLSRRGRGQVLHWLEWLKPVTIDAVHCSPQPQCSDPARAVAQSRELPLVPSPQLRDQELGKWQGRIWDDVMREDPEALRTFFSEFGDARAPGGESLGAAVERVLAWWTETAPAAVGKTLVAVLPGALISGFAAAMLGMRLSRCVSLNLPHGGLGVLDVFANGVRIASWNPFAVLEPLPAGK